MSEVLTDPCLLAEWLASRELTEEPYYVNGNSDPESEVTTDEVNITLHKDEIAVIVAALRRSLN